MDKEKFISSLKSNLGRLNVSLGEEGSDSELYAYMFGVTNELITSLRRNEVSFEDLLVFSWSMGMIGVWRDIESLKALQTHGQ